MVTERKLALNSFSIQLALELGQLAVKIASIRDLPIAVEIRIQDWIIFHASLPGSTSENQWWLDRKAQVVSLKNHSTLYERISAEERGVDWYKENNVSEDTYAIHGGGFPLIVKKQGFVGSLLISGLPHLEDHAFCVDILTKFIKPEGK